MTAGNSELIARIWRWKNFDAVDGLLMVVVVISWMLKDPSCRDAPSPASWMHPDPGSHQSHRDTSQIRV